MKSNFAIRAAALLLTTTLISTLPTYKVMAKDINTISVMETTTASSLENGTYEVTGSFLKGTSDEVSMSNGIIKSTELVVDATTYKIILNTQPLTVNTGTSTVTAYLLGLQYEDNGTYKDAEVTRKDSDGNITQLTIALSSKQSLLNIKMNSGRWQEARLSIDLSTAVKKVETVKLADGTYTVPVKLYKAADDTESMGNAAIDQRSKLVVKNGEGTLYIGLKSMKSMNMEGYVSELNLMKNIKFNEYNYPEIYDKVESTVVSTYDVKDAYNNSNSTDSNVKGKKYPKEVSIPVTISDEYSYIHMYVPVMGSFGTGDVEARLKVDYLNAKNYVNPSIKLDAKAVTLSVGKTKTLKATVTGESKTVKWKSSNAKIATVKNGKITAKKAGTVIITASANGKEVTCKVTVKKAPAKK